jgi:AcrR family transcriptional regulator
VRADALRSQAAVLHAAHGLYSERGLAVSLNEIAKRAGVGNATLYRHFVTHDDLIADVFGEQMQRYCKITEDAILIPDASEALRTCVRQICELQASNKGLADLIGSLELTNERLDALRARVYVALQRLIRRARRARAVRPDFTPEDIAVLLIANAGVIRRTADDAPAASARLVAVWLDGTAPEAATPGPKPPSPQTLTAAMRPG